MGFVRRLRAFVVRVREEVESVRCKGFSWRLSSVSSVSSPSSVSSRSSSRVILDKV